MYGIGRNANEDLLVEVERGSVIVFRRVDGRRLFRLNTYVMEKGSGGKRARGRAALLHGILISVNYSREWHVLLTFALSLRRSGRIQFCRPLARSAVPFSREPTWLAARISSSRRRVVAVARGASNRQVLPRDARRLILSPKAYPCPASWLLLLLLQEYSGTLSRENV